MTKIHHTLKYDTNKVKRLIKEDKLKEASNFILSFPEPYYRVKVISGLNYFEQGQIEGI